MKKKEFMELLLNEMSSLSPEIILWDDQYLREFLCEKLISQNRKFSLNIMENHVLDLLKEKYINRSYVEYNYFEELKKEEIFLIEKYTIFNQLKKLSKEELERLDMANKALKDSNFSNYLKNNSNIREMVIEEMLETDSDFFEQVTQKESYQMIKLKYLEKNINFTEIEQIKLYEEEINLLTKYDYYLKINEQVNIFSKINE